MTVVQASASRHAKERVHFHAPLVALLAIAFLMVPTTVASAAESCAALKWSQLPPLPDRLGVAGPFAGVSGGTLLVAGGANFPDKMPWEGGTKVWHDTVYALDQPDGRWRIVGRLPRPLGYGVSVSDADALVCVGGSDVTRHYADTFRLCLRGGQLVTKPLPPLPIPLANMSGAVISNVLYVAAGTETPGEQRATGRFFALALKASQPAWRELESLPGLPRLLATAAACDGAFHLFGGVALEPNAQGKIARVYLRDAWRYRPGEGWSRLADLPTPSAAGPSPAPVVAGRVLLLGGDDGSHVGFQPLDQHPGFSKAILAYDPALDHWTEACEVPAPRATLPCVEWRGQFILPSGEARPGVRSPAVWGVTSR